MLPCVGDLCLNPARVVFSVVLLSTLLAAVSMCVFLSSCGVHCQPPYSVLFLATGFPALQHHYSSHLFASCLSHHASGLSSVGG
jgi:hypothetical protein